MYLQIYTHLQHTYLYKSNYIIYNVTEVKLDFVAVVEYDKVVQYQQ